MRFDDAFIGAQLMYIDTAPFIYYTENRAGFVEKMRAIFQRAVDAHINIVTSTITLTECLTRPLQQGDTALVTAYNVMLRSTRHIKLISVDVLVAARAADLRARYKLLTPDALHVASGLVTGCDVFLTNDMRLKRVQETRILILDELEIDE